MIDKTSDKKKIIEWLWDAWCIFSIVGVWPRFIEPRLLSITQLSLPIPMLPTALAGFKILQFSDLHWKSNFSPMLLNKLTHKIKQLQPDLIVFTGDFLCRSHLYNSDQLTSFFQSLDAKAGCFAVLGNHDYKHFVTVNAHGDYDVDMPSSKSMIEKGLRRLCSTTTISGTITEAARNVAMHAELQTLLHKTPFKLLNNETVRITHQGAYLNICGLGEYTLGRCDPIMAFKNYNINYHGIILAHNPDSIKILQHYPGDLILCGHTHGGQINLPFFWQRLTRLENMELKRGLKKIGQTKWAYINRGIASMMKFRWFSIPELTLITLQRS